MVRDQSIMLFKFPIILSSNLLFSKLFLRFMPNIKGICKILFTVTAILEF